MESSVEPHGNGMVRVFLGSTREDLVEFRESTLAALSRLALRIEAMELWNASSHEPIEECLKRVRDSDVYICILAFRYGVQLQDGRSFTEAEFDLATELHKDRLAFLLRDDALFPPKFVDKGRSADKVVDFREKVKSQLHCGYFSSPSDLAQKVLESLKELLVGKGNQVAAAVDLRSFWQDVQTAWRRRAPEDMLIPFDPSDDELTLLARIGNQVRGLEEFHRYLKESYSRLPADLRAVLAELGVDPTKANELVIARRLFEFRDWELVTFFPNRTGTIRIALAHLRVRLLERMSRAGDWGPEHARMLSDAKKELAEAIHDNSVYID